jgi:hypothetical protein
VTAGYFVNQNHESTQHLPVLYAYYALGETVKGYPKPELRLSYKLPGERE